MFWNVNELNDKRANSAHLLPQIGDKNVKWQRRDAVASIFGELLERECASL